MAKKQSGGGKRKANLPALIEQYYADLEALTYQRVFAEMGTRTAFHTLLHEEGKRHGWTLIAEHEKKVNGRLIRPDGTFKDQLNLVRGYWEAKDTDDKLDIEIEKKRKAGYPRLPRLRVGLPAASPRSILTAELLRNLRRSSEKEARRVSERIGRVEVAFPLVLIMERTQIAERVPAASSLTRRASCGFAALGTNRQNRFRRSKREQTAKMGAL